MPRQIHNDSGDPARDVCGRSLCGHQRRGHNGPCTAKRLDPFDNRALPCRCPGFVEPRKPASKRPTDVVSIRLTWQGAEPAVGDFLMSQHRPRFAYRIEDVCRSGQALEISGKRVLVSEVPAGATVHPMRWNARDAVKNNTGWSA